MQVSYATDVHGSTVFIQDMLEKSAKRKVDAIIINGDLTPDEYFMDFIAQREFFESFMIPTIWKFRKKNKIDVFVLMGNHDYKENMDVFHKAEKSGIFKSLHNEVHKMGKYNITGYSYINPIGFMNWEKQEHEIMRDLEKLKGKADFSKTIFVSHAPPYNTKLDVVFSKRHVGSKSVREFINRHQPYLALHGHIHESPRVSGSMEDRIGKTVCINPGNQKMIIINLDNRKMEIV